MTDRRFLTEFDIEKIEKRVSDVLIIGSGIAGVFTALGLADKLDIMIITKEALDISSSFLAQGGIAVSLDKDDSPLLHFKDTLYAGAGLCDEENVWALVNEAAQNIEKLCSYGVNFDKDEKKVLSLTKEGAHSKSRIIHAGDTTGKVVCDTLISSVKCKENVKIFEKIFAIDFLTKQAQNECFGILAFDENTGEKVIFLAKYIVCASGGFGRIYSYTTNPPVATGDGAAMAFRAGAELVDLEFVQFHPTVLYHPQDKSFLISEAVRGEGARLLNKNGEYFMDRYHEMKDLAPRDVVSRAIFEEMNKTNSSNVYLDITHKSREFLEGRFPNIYKTCLNYGIDISKDYIPVAPAEHYCMGGIRSDMNGRTNINRLYACGEATGNGIHGANRLASNSLLEGLVFGNRIAKDIFKQEGEKHTVGNNKSDGDWSKSTDSSFEQDLIQISKENEKIIDEEYNNVSYDKIESLTSQLRNNMTENVGIIRSLEGLQKAKSIVDEILKELENIKIESPQVFELINMITISNLVVSAAMEREESRGAHFREDFKQIDDINWKRSIVLKKR